MPSVLSARETSTTSGITTDSTGQRHIPTSTRADGSQRKEIKIRPGYRPPEDVQVYKNRTAHAYATRGTGGIPGAEGLKDDDDSKKQDGKLSKNAKRREARKKAKANGVEEDAAEEDEQPIQTPEESKLEPVLSKEEQEQVENEKKAKKLRKKLREARDLQEKKEKGEKLLHEQFEKVIKINELIKDLDKLGFGPDGEPKEGKKQEGTAT